MGADRQLATFAGGCFWCLQGPYEVEPGVSNVHVGYSGGPADTAHYSTVASGTTQHRESIHMEYDPAVVAYERLLEIFWKNIDPTDPGGQFADRGHQYTTAILFHTSEQQQLAEQSKRRLDDSKKFTKPIATVIEPFVSFFPAEEEHQRYYTKQPLAYQQYARGSGRADFLQNTWKK